MLKRLSSISGHVLSAITMLVCLSYEEIDGMRISSSDPEKTTFVISEDTDVWGLKFFADKKRNEEQFQ